MAKKKAETAGGEGAMGFEEAMARVEAIVERIESGEVGLEESLAEYERGIALLKRCREVLERAELRVRELSADAEPPAGRREGGA
ncbi:MAG: exodeoxyribonuclease VII small subunit [Phycisphaerales bacterium]|jgi:exodeoxyribonuclease VII small subunit|nr:exodeoxyribonuclease VII small subunit [Phycisphaerales bacterium]